MIVFCTLIILFALFFFVRKHIGPAHLAVIAGVSVYSLIAPPIVSLATSVLNATPGTVQNIVYLILVFFFPLILYLRSDRGGLKGLWRILHAAIFALLMTALLTDFLAGFFEFDVIARDLANIVDRIRPYILLAGIAAAYFDILLYRKPKLD